MIGSEDQRNVEVLRRRAERALDEGRGRLAVEPLLERILDLASADDPACSFAHHHLAELRLERDPWSSALHLRKVLETQPRDDVAHSLMALAQALLGNYRAAVASYRRALRFAPKNPWYHHNLGHILDVALDDPSGALPHLTLALEHSDPSEHEITASAAHCLARVGRLEEARELAESAIASAPSSADHRALLRWIDKGAPPSEPVHPRPADAHAMRVAGAVQPAAHKARADMVGSILERHLEDAGFTEGQVERATALLADYRDEAAPRVKKPEVLAAAVHYAIALVLGRDRVTQASIARRYGVAPGSVSNRYADIRQTLALTPGDPRYGTNE